MESTCPACGATLKNVPAGISQRTGKPYNAFTVCSNRECNWKPGTSKVNYPAQPAQRQTPTRDDRIEKAFKEKQDNTDWRMAVISAKDIVVKEMEKEQMTDEQIKYRIKMFATYLYNLEPSNLISNDEEPPIQIEDVPFN